MTFETFETFEKAARAVADRYAERSAHWYVRSKLAMDPVARKLVELGAAEPFGDVLDIATGRGQLALLLRETGACAAIHGVDWDAAKIAIAERAATGLEAVTFTQGDVRVAELPPADTVLLVDILHYLTHPEQDALVLRAARATRGRLLLRDVDPDQGAASVFTQGWEWVTTTLGYNRGARVAPRSFVELAALLEQAGLTVSREPCSAKGMSNMLLVGRR
ncbi:MAG: Glutamate synthase large chain [Labilithrix sp.]|nr:Glutamate synthase large chain [Labilithrix sp.]